jgi:hypothetical protein
LFDAAAAKDLFDKAVKERSLNINFRRCRKTFNVCSASLKFRLALSKPFRREAKYRLISETLKFESR